MLTSILDAMTRTPRRALITAAAATVVAALPATAHAHSRFHVDIDVPVVVDPCPPQPTVVYAPQPAQVWVEPVYRTVSDRQWVPATYRTVDTQIWVPATTASVPQRVFVPAEYGWQTVVAYDRRGRPYHAQQQVLISPAHYEDRCASVVTPGHFECTQQQQLVCEGHWATVDRQECVTPGHWETRCDATVVPVAPIAPAQVRIRLPF